jgi:hypothetical protein
MMKLKKKKNLNLCDRDNSIKSKLKKITKFNFQPPNIERWIKKNWVVRGWN